MKMHKKKEKRSRCQVVLSGILELQTTTTSVIVIEHEECAPVLCRLLN